MGGPRAAAHDDLRSPMRGNGHHPPIAEKPPQALVARQRRAPHLAEREYTRGVIAPRAHRPHPRDEPERRRRRSDRTRSGPLSASTPGCRASARLRHGATSQLVTFSRPEREERGRVRGKGATREGGGVRRPEAGRGGERTKGCRRDSDAKVAGGALTSPTDHFCRTETHSFARSRMDRSACEVHLRWHTAGWLEGHLPSYACCPEHGDLPGARPIESRGARTRRMGVDRAVFFHLFARVGILAISHRFDDPRNRVKGVNAHLHPTSRFKPPHRNAAALSSFTRQR